MTFGRGCIVLSDPKGNRRFPKDRTNRARQEARMAYNLCLLMGSSLEEAERDTIGWVRSRHPRALF